MDGVRLTSLFGVGGVLKERDCGRIGTPDAWEKAAIDESGPMLDRSLPCCERGRRESLLIHDPLDEMEALGVSEMVAKAGCSPCLESDCLLLRDFGDVTCAVRGRW